MVSHLMVRSLLAGDAGFMRLLERRGLLEPLAKVTDEEESAQRFIMEYSKRLRVS